MVCLGIGQEIVEKYESKTMKKTVTPKNNQSLLNKERFLGLSKITKQKNRTFSKVLCLKNNYNQHTCK